MTLVLENGINQLYYSLNVFLALICPSLFTWRNTGAATHLPKNETCTDSIGSCGLVLLGLVSNIIRAYDETCLYFNVFCFPHVDNSQNEQHFKPAKFFFYLKITASRLLSAVKKAQDVS